MTPQARLDDAAQTLIFYFRRAGLDMSSDQCGEIESAVNAIFDAAVDAAIAKAEGENQ